jgi:hypothetical protein
MSLDKDETECDECGMVHTGERCYNCEPLTKAEVDDIVEDEKYHRWKDNGRVANL